MYTALLLVSLCLLTTGAEPEQAEDDAGRTFQARLSEYLAMKEELRCETGGRVPSAIRVQKARAGAAPLDIIPEALADTIRERLHRAFDPTEVDVLLLGLYPDGVPELTACVNACYDDRVAVAPPASVLGALPPVPGGLGYRLIGTDLVLWDDDARLVLDVVVGALPEPRIWAFLEVSSAELRRVVRDGLHAAHIDPYDLAEDIARDHLAGARRPVIGEPFDWRAGNLMPPSVLRALPPLPALLEYRFVGTDLVVIDMSGGDVAGILTDVLPLLTRHDRIAPAVAGRLAGDAGNAGSHPSPRRSPR